MKLTDIEIDQLVKARRAERSAWISVATQQGRKHSAGERMTINLLAAWRAF
jgi:hypothetical protein